MSDVKCILTVEKLRHKAEATASVNGGTIYCDHTEEDMYAAIDGLVDNVITSYSIHYTKLYELPRVQVIFRRQFLIA